MCNSCCVPTEEISHYFRFPPTLTRTGSEQKFVSRNPDSNKNLPEFQSFLNLYKLKKKLFVVLMLQVGTYSSKDPWSQRTTLNLEKDCSKSSYMVMGMWYIALLNSLKTESLLFSGNILGLLLLFFFFSVTYCIIIYHCSEPQAWNKGQII